MTISYVAVTIILCTFFFTFAYMFYILLDQQKRFKSFDKRLTETLKEFKDTVKHNDKPNDQGGEEKSEPLL